MYYNVRMTTHHHAHLHEPAPDFGRAFRIGVLLNTGFVAAEVLWGLKANSLALLADAGHNFGDVLGLLLAWAAMGLARRKPSARFTYGLQSASIMAALANAIILLITVGGIGWEALQRLSHPQSVAGGTVIAVAALGILINGATALLFMKGSRHDLNIRAAFLHMAADAAISLGVVIAGLIILQTGWLWLDPAASLCISIAIIAGTWGLFRESTTLALHAAPKGIDAERVRAFLMAQPGVSEIHDLHIWAMSTTETALSTHLLMPGGYPGGAFINNLSRALEHEFHIGHATIQIEVDKTSESCALATRHAIGS